MSSGFIETITSLRREVRDIKTAQPKAFGAVNFVKKTASYTAGVGSFKITATAEPGAVTPFFCQLAFSQIIPFSELVSVLSNETQNIWVYDIFSGSATFTVTAVAACPFDLTVGPA